MLVAENRNTFFFKFSNSCGLICFKRPEVTGKKEGLFSFKDKWQREQKLAISSTLHFSAHFREEALKRPRLSQNLEFASCEEEGDESRGFHIGSFSGNWKCVIAHITSSFDVVILP